MIFVRNLIGLIFFFIAAPCAAQVVNIPDAAFKDYLISDYDINTNRDGEIQLSEAVNYTLEIDISNLPISDLTGLESFTEITSFNCYNVGLTSLDLSMNTKIKTLYCNNNNLSSLNVSMLPDLTILQCNHNSIASLNLNGSLVLREVYCIDNSLTTLDVSMLTDLRVLYCSNNQISLLTIANGSFTPRFNRLRCDQNLLTELNLSSYPDLNYLDCGNNQLTDLDVSNGSNNEFIHFNALGNDLSCVEVDNASWSNVKWGDLVDLGVLFSTSCP